jgi:arsenate reductase
MAITIYGIPNCDTMKKARTWLDARGVAYGFHDYRANGLERDRLKSWVAKVGWERLLNKASTTFRELPENDRASLDEAQAIALMLKQPTMIKRPVLDRDGTLTVGFKPDVYAGLFGKD